MSKSEHGNIHFSNSVEEHEIKVHVIQCKLQTEILTTSPLPDSPQLQTKAGLIHYRIDSLCLMRYILRRTEFYLDNTMAKERILTSAILGLSGSYMPRNKYIHFVSALVGRACYLTEEEGPHLVRPFSYQ